MHPLPESVNESVAAIAVLQDRLGYEWIDGARLRQALTHSSYGNAHSEPHSEILEFLGDSVLDLVTAEWLMAKHPDRREGFMSQQRALMVQRDTLSRHAQRLGIDRALRLGPKDDYLRGVDSVLADALEAVVGALYRDCGSVQVVRERLLAWGLLT